MGKDRREELIRLVREENIEIIKLQFTDLFGNPKNVEITAAELPKALDNRCLFDGSAIEGFVRTDETDMYLYPDLDTFAVLPWGGQHRSVARLICDVCGPSGEPFEGDPRFVLKKVIEEAKAMGVCLSLGPECEFFLFHTDEEGRPTTTTHESAGYFDAGPVDLAENVRRDIVCTLGDMGFQIERAHHELSPGQHEIDLKYGPGLKAADDIVTFKMGVKAVAKRHGLCATFMPKPKEGVNGSGMHFNLILTDTDGNNLFADTGETGGAFCVAGHFMAGILAHMRGLSLLTNPLVNSYKRLVQGYDAPVYIAWSASSNRSAVLKLSAGRGEESRIELRCPDSAVNPYLALAGCLAAGLDGIRKKMELPGEESENLCGLTDQERCERGVQRLPETLGEAIEAFESDLLFARILGGHLWGKYLEAKKEEWNLFRAQVTDWEIQRYLYRV